MTQSANREQKLSLLYDGACYLCDMEIKFYKRRDKENQLDLVDISEPSFNAEDWGLDQDKVQLHFHARDQEDTWHVGVDAFVAIWRCLGINSMLVGLATNSKTKPLFQVGYKAFANIRPFLPRKNQCTDGTCSPQV